MFEPRSITSCLKTFQKEYSSSFAAADRVFISSPYHRFDPDIALDAGSLAGAITARGVPAVAYDSVGSILEALSRDTTEGTVVLCMSNGEFEAIAARLATVLHGRISTGPK